MGFAKNLGSADRLIRLIVGIALIAMVFVGPHTPWGWIGAILVVTAFMSFCPIYRIFGIRTCKPPQS